MSLILVVGTDDDDDVPLSGIGSSFTSVFSFSVLCSLGMRVAFGVGNDALGVGSICILPCMTICRCQK